MIWRTRLNILFVYPETPASFWSFKDALKFVAKKAPEPPLGLITVAAMLPKNNKFSLLFRGKTAILGVKNWFHNDYK